MCANIFAKIFTFFMNINRQWIYSHWVLPPSNVDIEELQHAIFIRLLSVDNGTTLVFPVNTFKLQSPGAIKWNEFTTERVNKMFIVSYTVMNR